VPSLCATFPPFLHLYVAPLNALRQLYCRRKLISESCTLGQTRRGAIAPHREAHLDPTIEQQLIAELQRGSDRALAAVYQEFSQGVFAYCLKILADRQLAEDVVQETFLKVRQHAQSIQRNESFKSWVFRIARNEALMQLRKKRSNGQIEDESVWSEETPHQQFVALERTEIVNRLLDNLKHGYREVLVLLAYEGMSYSEIASVTGATESSVKSRIFRARKEMIEKMKPYGEHHL